VVIDNKAGAGTVIGNDFVAKSAPDGHTLLINTNAFAAVVALHAKLPYGGENAFSAVTLLGRAPNVAVVNADSSLKSGADFLSYAKANPGKLSYGSAGNGTSTHLAAELLKSNRQFFITHIPYRGATPAITDLMGGQVDVVFGTLPSVAPFIASGKLRALAVTSTTRSALLPHVPTFAESGAKGYEADVWYGIFVAAGTPMPIVQQLNAALKRVTATPEFKKRAQGEGLVISMETPEEAQAIVRADVIKWRKVVQAQSIKPD
jgi:tripartite-type tricarboxylate transporter receptor subunit TctC